MSTDAEIHALLDRVVLAIRAGRSAEALDLLVEARRRMEALTAPTILH